MKKPYLETIQLIERLHRQFLEVVKGELDTIGIADINNVQALILSHIGDEELTVGELTYRGYYLGSNVSYNLKKMVENGYLEQQRSSHDRRTMRVSLTKKGAELCKIVEQMFDNHVVALADRPDLCDTIEDTATSLARLERFWRGCLSANFRRAERENLTAA